MMRIAIVLCFATGCFDMPCTPNEWRCNGDTLQTCTPHGGGLYGIPPHYVHSSEPTWDTAAACESNSCVTPVAGEARAFCALDATPEPACTADGFACAGDTLVRCRDGFAISRERCKQCDAAHGTCDGALFATCRTTADCAAGMVCDPIQGCEQPCDCADGTECAACDADQRESVDPDNGHVTPLVCRAGQCN